MRHPNMLEARRAVLVIVDMQENFRAAIPRFTETAARIALMTHAAQLLHIPVIVTEQYPKGLGRTVNEIRAVLPTDFEPVEKSCFSACGSQEFQALLHGTDDAPDAQQILLCGIEAHICVNQTAHELLAQNFQVHLLTDCIASRHEHDKQAAIDKMKLGGAIPATIEMALFEMLRDACHEQFKAVQRLIK